MSLIEDIESKIKANPMYGVRFSIGPDAYSCSLDDSRVEFGDNHTFMNGGTTYNYQPIIIDGNEVGELEEIVPYHTFGLEPMRTSFIIYLREDEVTKEIRKSPHYVVSPYDFDTMHFATMHFATLQQFIDYLNIK